MANKLPVSQKSMVFWHLKHKKSITSWEAIKEYGATRLSAIIYDLRHKHRITILDTFCIAKNRFGNAVVYKKYFIPDEEKKRIKGIEI